MIKLWDGHMTYYVLKLLNIPQDPIILVAFGKEKPHFYLFFGFKMKSNVYLLSLENLILGSTQIATCRWNSWKFRKKRLSITSNLKSLNIITIKDPGKIKKGHLSWITSINNTSIYGRLVTIHILLIV